MRYAIVLYDGVEPIDVGATFGVLSMAKRVEPSIEMFAVAKRAAPVICANGLQVMPDCTFGDFPGSDVVVVTGGPGWPDAAGDSDMLNFLTSVSQGSRLASICTGAMILAAASLLDERTATTKIEVIGEERSPLDLLAERYPNVAVIPAVAALSKGTLTSGGVSLGIDGMFYLLRLLHGPRVADETARIMEYARALKANAQAMPPVGMEER